MTTDLNAMIGRNTGASSTTPAAIVIVVILLMTMGVVHAQPGFTQTGIASYYGKKFHGKKTANGERFSMWGLTAAHKTIPFDSKVRVTNLDNGKSVVVRINDFGPHLKGRIIDLSRGAAAKIGMIETGTARVKVEVLSDDGKADHEKSKGNTAFFQVNVARAELSGWGVQVASFERFDNLLVHLDRLAQKGIDNAHVQMATVDGRRVHRLVVGGYETEAAAEWKRKSLAEQGIDGFVFRIP
ncbi:MAG: septal ring lytic transglycosylase RlpA family protein [Bacteroidetes bacterium]|nr:septal ring lytic transglycosylase RlpA family protein [Bacteroidota bacterium]